MNKSNDNFNNKVTLSAQPWFVFTMFIIFSPLGLYFMWKHRLYSRALRQIITSLCVGTYILLAANMLFGSLEVPAPKTTAVEKSAIQNN